VDAASNSTAGGNFATIPGGYANSAAAQQLRGRRSRERLAERDVRMERRFRRDATDRTHAYEFLARASGGFTFWTNAAGNVGAQLAPGSGTWAVGQRSESQDRRRAHRRTPRYSTRSRRCRRALELQVRARRASCAVRMAQRLLRRISAFGEDDKHSPRSTKTASRLPRSRRCTPRTLTTQRRSRHCVLRNARLRLDSTQSSQIASCRPMMVSIRAEIQARR